MIGPGKRTKLWLRIRRQWIQQNPPNHEGAYLCSICAKPVHYSTMELDHIAGRKGENLSELDNLAPTHRHCNQLKGSQKWLPKVTPSEYELRKKLNL